MCCSVTLPLLVLLSAGISAALLPRHVSSLIPILQSLEADDVVNVPSLIRSLGGCGTPICHTVLGDPPPIPTPIPELWVPLSHLLHPTTAAHGTVLAPDGSTVALAPLFAGIEVGLKRAMGRPSPTDSPIDGPYNDLDPLYAVTITEALGTSFLMAHVNGTTPLGPDGCWDDVDNPQNFTFMGPPSPIPDAVINGAMDGVLLGTRLAQDPIPLSILFRTYYGVDNGIARGSPHSSRRRQDFGSLVAMERLEEEVGGVLRVLRGLPHTRGLLEGLGEEEEADIAHRAAQEFMELYVGCPAIIPRCMWGARPYRGTPKALSPPLGSIYIHHTFVPSAPCRSFSTCARDMRSMQLFHQDTRGWDDIGYSFVVGSDGYLYQGRGWRWVGAHTRGHNTQGYGVGYVGNFSAILPDPDAISLVRDALIPCAVRAGWLHHNYTLHGHRQMGNTSCPGDALFQEIQSWHGFK
ncbi:N-acetylmuramoyl-L-alanine amidase-like [Coturnix japonica]|nr:N-acetylmuramoyl-L-alanine amidase-like [Coturnix japonica]